MQFYGFSVFCRSLQLFYVHDIVRPFVILLDSLDLLLIATVGLAYVS